MSEPGQVLSSHSESDASIDSATDGVLADEGNDSVGPVVSTLAFGQTTPVDIAANEEDVYWITRNPSDGLGNTYRMRPRESHQPVAVASDLLYPRALAMAPDRAYWVNDSGELFAEFDYIPRRLGSYENGWVDCFGLVADESGVFLACSSSVARFIPGENHFVVLQANESRAERIGVNSTHVCWSRDGEDWSIRCQAKDSTATTTRAIEQGVIETFAVDATHAYWTRVVVGKRRLTRVEIAGTSQPEDLLVGLETIADIAVDGSHIYWTDWGTTGDNGIIRRMGKTSRTPETLVDQQWRIGKLAVTESHIYWLAGVSSERTGKVVMMRKP